jgi:hypothetical protein
MIELQSGNDTAMPLRMAEYCLGVYRVLGRFPQQVVLYVGEPALGMQSKPLGPGVLFEYELIDTRTLDGERLLESDAVGDDIIATLARLRDHRRAVGKIMKRIAGLGHGGAGSRAGTVVYIGWVAALIENGGAGGAEYADNDQYFRT